MTTKKIPAWQAEVGKLNTIALVEKPGSILEPLPVWLRHPVASITFKILLKSLQGWVMETLAFNTTTWEAEAGRFLSLRSGWSTECVPGQPELHREILS